MYQPDKDKVVACMIPLQPQAAAPMPVVVSNEWRVFMAYYTPDCDAVALISFNNPCAHFFGPPNDEAFEGHPLASRGLRPYSINEIVDSSWIHALERMNAVHHHHDPQRFARYKHYIFAFHDSTFECVAEGFEAKSHQGSLASAVQLMTQLLNGAQDP